MINRTKIARGVMYTSIGLTAVLLIATLLFVHAESTWVHPKSMGPEESFRYSTTGTEIMPLPVFQVLPVLFPDQFQPGGPGAGDWIDQYGFIRGQAGVNDGLPSGFFISNHRPKSGSPSPVPFVGINCSLCHTSLIKRTDNDPGVVVRGMGSTSLDFIAWVDGFKTAVLDEKRMTPKAIFDAYEKQSGTKLSLSDQLMIRLWLMQTRKTVQDLEPQVDNPYGGADLRNAQLMPNGPSRTQPFRNLVRNIMDRPALLDHGYCKLPTLYEQQYRTWGQYDGSVHDRLTRSVLAAMAIGATMQNLSMPEISNNVEQSIAYTLDLRGPKFTDIFPDQKLDPQKVVRGAKVYTAYCDSCHGHPDSAGTWVRGAEQDAVIPYEKLGVDGERVNFRYYDTLGDALVNSFPAKQPLRPKREDIRPGPLGNTRGYIGVPIVSAYSHAPFLHNGSIPTMAALVNLKPRPNVFYRGANNYDPVDGGLIVLDQPDAKRYFRFDASVLGNSNKGHDYPWAYKGPGWDEGALQDLLEYMKTL
jgi:mono/diheme cytochrome c family protein